MPWSRLKSLVESRQAPSLGRRVTIHQARYRYAQEEVGRVWVAIDGQEVAAFATHMGWARVRTLTDALAVLDGRLGKRRLRALALPSDEHPLVRAMFTLRCDVEGIRHPSPAV